MQVKRPTCCTIALALKKNQIIWGIYYGYEKEKTYFLQEGDWENTGTSKDI